MGAEVGPREVPRARACVASRRCKSKDRDSQSLQKEQSPVTTWMLGLLTSRTVKQEIGTVYPTKSVLTCYSSSGKSM